MAEKGKKKASAPPPAPASASKKAATKSKPSAVWAADYLEVNDDAAEKNRRTTSAAASAATHVTKMTNAEIAALLTSVVKMSTANKITQNNCWSLQLTENLTEVLGTTSGANAFQTAASAIDASVKIFAMRVDSVHQETFKLQSGLNRTDVGDDGPAGAAADAAAAGDGRPAAPPKRKAPRMNSTIAKNEDDLDVAGFDAQYEEDPLVKKAASAFDSSGARGLLLNQLGLFQGLTLVFDSGDAPQDAGRPVENEDTSATLQVGGDLREQFAQLMARIGAAEICPEVQTYKSSGSMVRRDDFLQAQLEQMQPANVFPVHQFSQLVLQPSAVASQLLQQQQQPFSPQRVQSQTVLAPSSQEPAMQEVFDDEHEHAPASQQEQPLSQQPVAAMSQQSQGMATVYAVPDHFDSFGGGGDDDDLDDAPRDFDAEGNIVASPGHGPSAASSAPTMQGAVQVKPGNAPVGNGEIIVENNGQISDEMMRALVTGIDEMGYYKAKPTNWAGPDKWSFKGPKAMKAAAAARADGEEGGGGGNDENGDVAAAAAKPARKKRAPADAQYFVDFARPADVNWDEAFAPPKRGNTKLTKSSKEKAKLLTTVLPADVHYGPNVLMSLFTKPKWMIPKQILSWRPIVDPAAQGQVPLAVAEGELELARPHEEQQEGSATAWFNNAALVDEPPASQQQQQQFGGLLDDDDFDNGGYGDELMYGEGGEPLSASQQQHEQQQRAMASARKSMAFAGPMVFEVGGVQREFLVAEPQRVEQIALHHAKAVRAVDVKMLKASIWRSLNLPAARRDSAAAAASEQPNPAAPEVQSFQELLDVLPSRIPRFEQSNVTIPFCFISLLHLANERGLELRSDGLDNLEIVQH